MLTRAIRRERKVISLGDGDKSRALGRGIGRALGFLKCRRRTVIVISVFLGVLLVGFVAREVWLDSQARRAAGDNLNMPAVVTRSWSRDDGTLQDRLSLDASLSASDLVKGLSQCESMSIDRASNGDWYVQYTSIDSSDYAKSFFYVTAYGSSLMLSNTTSKQNYYQYGDSTLSIGIYDVGDDFDTVLDTKVVSSAPWSHYGRDMVLEQLQRLGFSDDDVTETDACTYQRGASKALSETVNDGSTHFFGRIYRWTGSSRTIDGRPLYISASIETMCPALYLPSAGVVPEQVDFHGGGSTITFLFSTSSPYEIEAPTWV